MKSFTVALTVISMTTAGLPVYAGDKPGQAQGHNPPETPCDPKIVNDIYASDQFEDLYEQIEIRFREKKGGPRSDEAFCRWLHSAYRIKDAERRRTEARWDPNCVRCDGDVPRELGHTPGIDGDTRRVFRDVERGGGRVVVKEVVRTEPAAVEGGGGGFFGGNMGPMLAGGLIGFGLGMMLGNRNQQPQFMNPQMMYPHMGHFPPGMMRPGMPMGGPQIAPWLGPQYGGYGNPQIAPWLGGAQYGAPGFGQPMIQPWPAQNAGYNPYLYGGYNGGAFSGVPGVGYARPAPSILPMTTGYQPYSVTGSVPATHWGLINGR